MHASIDPPAGVGSRVFAREHDFQPLPLLSCRASPPRAVEMLQREQRVQRVSDKSKALAQLAELKRGGGKRSDQFNVRRRRSRGLCAMLPRAPNG